MPDIPFYMASLSKKAQETLLFMENEKVYNKQDLFAKVHNWYMTDKEIVELAGEGLISISRKTAFGHVVYMISLTPKGLAFKEQLRRLEEAFTSGVLYVP